MNIECVYSRKKMTNPSNANIIVVFAVFSSTHIVIIHCSKKFGFHVHNQHKMKWNDIVAIFGLIFSINEELKTK